MAQSRGGEEKNIPRDKIYREHLDWFDLGQTCINLNENGKTCQNLVQMPRNFKLKTCDKLESMLTSTHLQTPSTEQEYGKINAGMNPEEEPLNIEYSEREKEEWNDETEHEIVKECENNNREVDKSLESNEIIIENNKKLTQALEIEMAKYKQFRSKYNSAQKN